MMESEWEGELHMVVPDMKQIRMGTLQSRIECMEKTIRVLKKHYHQFESTPEYQLLHSELNSAREHCLQLIKRIENTRVVQ